MPDKAIAADSGIEKRSAAGLAYGVPVGNASGELAASWMVTMDAIADADGTIEDITTKFNTLLAQMRTAGYLTA